MKLQHQRLFEWVSLLCLSSLLLHGCGRNGEDVAKDEVVAKPIAGPSIVMTDVTREASIQFTHHNGASGRLYFVETLSGGCAFFDFDGDGWMDVLLLQGAPLPPSLTGSDHKNRFRASGNWRCALYHNNKNGTFKDVTHGSGLDIPLYAMGVTAGDYDNDGREDLYITAFGGNHLFHNEYSKASGQVRFRDVTDTAGVSGQDLSTSTAWLDYDRDGRLDLFVCRYTDYSLAKEKPCSGPYGPTICNPATYPGTRSLLYHNNGNGTFSDVTTQSHIAVSSPPKAGSKVLSIRPIGSNVQPNSPLGRGLGVVCADFDEDGWIDIYVADDTTPNRLFTNNKNGTFREQAELMGVSRGPYNEIAMSGMGVDSGDYDNDGNMDIAVTNMSREPISLYHNTGKGLFANNTIKSGLQSANQYVKWGIRFVDLDLDGSQDLFIANGGIFEMGTVARQQPCQIFRNQKKIFREVSRQAGDFFKRTQVARGAAFGDYDNDGRTDVLVACNDQPTVLLHNDSPSQNHWIRIALHGSARNLAGTGCNRDALGARVRVTTGSMAQTQYVRAGTSYLADHDRRLLFGIAQGSQAKIEVRWPCGALQTVIAKAGTTTVVYERGCRLSHGKPR